MSTIDPTATALPRAERVAWDDPRAQALRDAMEAEMNVRYADVQPTDPEGEAELHRVLGVTPDLVFATVLILDADDTPIGHAAVRDLGGEWEVKRVVVAPGQRGRGIGRMLMDELEAVAREAGAPRLILQTGDRQPEAVSLYERIGYTPIPIYEPYVKAIPFSLCYEKVLTA